MADPFSAAALGALAATEGIKFLYGQAAEVLKRWRDRKAGNEEEAQAPIPVPDQSLLKGKLESPTVDFDAVERLHEDIEALAGALEKYAGGLREPDPGDEKLAAAADGLRRALEVVYSQRLTFKDEQQREASGPVVLGRADVEKVAGDVAAVRARVMKSGRIDATLKAKEVTGRGAAVDIDTIGS
jgi:hypothetical protein